jgi:hypothetical protein
LLTSCHLRESLARAKDFAAGGDLTTGGLSNV